MSTQSASPIPVFPALDTGASTARSPLAGANESPLAEGSVLERAIAVIGDRSSAMRWLGTPVRALDYATPISLMHNVDGCERVLAVLGRIEHGVL